MWTGPAAALASYNFFQMRTAATLTLLCLVLLLGLGSLGVGASVAEHGPAVLVLTDGGDEPPTSLDGRDTPDGAVAPSPALAGRGTSWPWVDQAACAIRSCCLATPLPPPRPAQA